MATSKDASSWLCSTCEYFEPADTTCRIRSPVVVLAPVSAPVFHQSDLVSGWPTVKDTDWCGEWVEATYTATP